MTLLQDWLYNNQTKEEPFELITNMIELNGKCENMAINYHIRHSPVIGA